MAVHPLNQDAPIEIEGNIITITKPLGLAAPKAATFLAEVPNPQRQAAVEELLEHGAAVAAAVKTSASTVLLEQRIEQLTDDLNQTLGQQLKGAGDQSVETTQKLLQAHKQDLTRLLTPLTDADSKSGLPATMVELLDQANRRALSQIEQLLAHPKEGALGKAVSQICEQNREMGVEIMRQLAAKEELRRKSNQRGDDFEKVLASRLPVLCRGIGRVERCARAAGGKANLKGDYLLTLDQTICREELVIAIEAKSWTKAVSANAIRNEMRLVRENRGAAAGVFVTDSAGMLPDGIGFGQVSACDYYVAFNPEDGDETTLACALFCAKVAALETVAGQVGDQVDLVVARRELSLMQGIISGFSKLDAGLTKASKEISGAAGSAGELRADLLDSLRRLDAILTAV